MAKKKKATKKAAPTKQELAKQTLAANDDGVIKETDVKFALKYLEYYYVNPAVEAMAMNSTDDVACLTKQFQKMFHLPATGRLDAKTIKAMKTTPRCGCRDFAMAQSGPMAARWGTKELTYFIQSYVSGLSRADQDDLNALAFQQWADVADLRFTRVNRESDANLILSTGRGRAQGFDGPSGTLAWAYLPSGNNYQGQLLMRYDLDETWIKNVNDRGILFLNVACHEFGHLLGLDHTTVRGALMAPYYSPGITKPQQHDDVTRIQRLYGAPNNPPPPPPPPPPTPPPPPVPPPPPGSGVTIEIDDAKLSDITINGKNFTDFSLI